MLPYEALTDEVIKDYGDRKRPGRVSIVVDTLGNVIYVVPKNIEHIDFMALHFPGVDYRPFVPFHIDILDGEVADLIPGHTGLEYKLGVEHDGASVAIARGMAFEFIRKGNKKIKNK